MKKKFWSTRNLIIAIIAIVILGIGGYYLYSRAFSVLPDAAVALMSDVKEPTASDKVLIIAPHPDDETIAAGGYIERAEKNKAKVEILLVTDANRRGIGPERIKEFQDVTKSLGVDSSSLQYLNLPEYYLKDRVPQTQLTDLLEKKIDEFGPTIIIYPNANDQNRDHKFIGQTVDSILNSSGNITAYGYLVHFKYFPQPVGLHPNSNLTPPVKLVDFSTEWDRFLLSEDEESAKLSALLIYKSQLRTPLLHDLLVSMVRRNELFSAH